MNDIYDDFSLYGKSMGISGMDMSRHMKQIGNSLTPYILEERQLNLTVMDIFSRLMMERIIWIAGPVHDGMSTVVQGQLMYLDMDSDEDITLHIDTPGGSVKSGMSMIDVMDYINSDTRTICTGMAASMGSVLLGAGTKGKRAILPHSKVMLHQSSGGIQGNIQDARINYTEWEKDNQELFRLLGEYTGKDPKVVENDATRDFWLNPTEAKEYGIVDQIITKKGK
jgi:ATP-dependent Clp protease protease subunit